MSFKSVFQRFDEIFLNRPAPKDWTNATLEEVETAFPVGSFAVVKKSVERAVNDPVLFHLQGFIQKHEKGCNLTDRVVVWVGRNAFFPEDLKIVNSRPAKTSIKIPDEKIHFTVS